jgi:hypothetical protein
VLFRDLTPATQKRHHRRRDWSDQKSDDDVAMETGDDVISNVFQSLLINLPALLRTAWQLAGCSAPNSIRSLYDEIVAVFHSSERACDAVLPPGGHRT